MPSTDQLGFEMERRIIIFHRDTTMPDDTQLGYTGNPNDVINGNTPGESLLYNAPSGTEYLDKGEDPHTRYKKVQDLAGGTWNEVTSDGSVISGEYFESETFTLTETDITNMYVQLSQIPATSAEIEFHIRSAPAQEYGTDFKQDETFLRRITWETLGLEGSLQAGDEIRITYTRS